MKRTFTIDELYASAYVSAIGNVISVLNSTMKTKYFFFRDCVAVEIMAMRLGIKFDEDGEIVK